MPVFGVTGMGAFAEYLAVKPATIARGSHPTFPLRRAASVPGGLPNCVEGFSPRVTGKGKTILIHGGAGAVGPMRWQLASHAGATVIATASGDDEAYLDSLGASRVIDYRETPVPRRFCERKVDVVFDLIVAIHRSDRSSPLKKGGHLVATTQPYRRKRPRNTVCRAR